MTDCLFCKIIVGEIPSKTVYEDDQVKAFLDIHPVQPGHTLVVPKEHAETLTDLSYNVATSFLPHVQKIALAVVHATNAHGWNLMQNNSPASGQSVPHVHFHIVPRFENDGLAHWPGKAYAEGEADAMASKIQQAIS